MGHYKGRDNRKKRKARRIKNDYVILRNKLPTYGLPIFVNFYEAFLQMQEVVRVWTEKLILSLSGLFELPKCVISPDPQNCNYASSIVTIPKPEKYIEYDNSH